MADDGARERRRQRFGMRADEHEEEQERAGRRRGGRDRDLSPSRLSSVGGRRDEGHRVRERREDLGRAHDLGDVRGRLAPMELASDMVWYEPRFSRHVAQAMHDSFNKNGPSRDVAYSRSLIDSSPRTKYRRRRDEVKSVLTWRDRSRLLLLIEFLTQYGELAPAVLLVGASPARYLEILSLLFPSNAFVVYEPSSDPPEAIASNARVQWHREEFSLEIASAYIGTAILFFSDYDLDKVDDMQFQGAAHMNKQRSWVESLHPVASLLKFSLPWNDLTTEYYNGVLRLPVFAPATGADTYLLTTPGDGVRTYDNRHYEEQMFHFNCISRVALYPHSISGVPGLDHCYDCTSEVNILSDYATHFPSIAFLTIAKYVDPAPSSIEAAHPLAAYLSRAINEAIAPGSTLRDPRKRTKPKAAPVEQAPAVEQAEPEAEPVAQEETQEEMQVEDQAPRQAEDTEYVVDMLFVPM